MLRAGELRSLVAIEKPVTVATAFNEPKVTSWTLVASVWAKVHELPGREQETGAQITAIQMVDVTLRYRNDLQPHWRITVDGTRHLDIQSTSDPDGRREFLVVRCLERVGR